MTRKLTLISWLKYSWLFLLIVIGIWGIGTVYYTIEASTVIRTTAAVIYGTAATFLLFLAFRGHLTAASHLTVIELLLIFHFVLLTPEEVFRNTVWQRSWKLRARTEFSGSIATIHQVRDFIYHSETDFEDRYITMTVDLDKVIALDVAVSHWDGMEEIAHTMLSFAFSDGQYLAFSMETRLPENAEQGFIPGLYKQYELLSIVATEDDLYKLRTNYRKEELYLYRTKTSKEEARMILQALLQRINQQHYHPRFYNSLTHNCTTSLAPLLSWHDPGFSGDTRLLFNGFSDELLYDLGYLAHREGESFAELKKRRKVNPLVNTHPDYSTAIRTDL